MKKKLLSFIMIGLLGCTNASKQNESKDSVSVQKATKFKKFKSYIDRNLKEIKHDSVLNANKNGNQNSFLLSIIPSRGKGFWILGLTDEKTISSNFKSSKTEISDKSYDRIQKLLTELKKQAKIDTNFCFECHADPTFFVLEEINNGQFKQTINIIEDWQFICSSK